MEVVIANRCTLERVLCLQELRICPSVILPTARSPDEAILESCLESTARLLWEQAKVIGEIL